MRDREYKVFKVRYKNIIHTGTNSTLSGSRPAFIATSIFIESP
jgi:hypothetical protein